jgi:hypothetical protein
MHFDELPPVPSVDVYVSALVRLEQRLSDGQRSMLQAQYGATEHTATATELAAAAGYRHWRAANLQYGLLGKQLCELMSYDFDREFVQPSYVLSYFIPPDGVDTHEWQLIMQPNLVEALRLLRWFRDQAPSRPVPPVGSADTSAIPVAGTRINPGTERDFEQTVIVPLLQRWALPYRMEQFCRLRVRGQLRIGRIDVLVHTPDSSRTLTLFENKRRIAGSRDLDRAVRQANDYARAKRLRSFVIAAPQGLWIDSRPGGQPHLEKLVPPEEVAEGAVAARALLLALDRPRAAASLL